MSILKTELHEGVAYLLDSRGRIHRIVFDFDLGVTVETIYHALPHEVSEFMKPELAQYDRSKVV